MTERLLILFTIFFLIFFPCKINAQDQFFNPVVRTMVDSLNQRANAIRLELPRLSELRNAAFYFTKRELDITLFLIEYHQYIANEELEKARNLIETKLRMAKKWNDIYLTDYYTDYNRQLTIEFGKRQARYQKLFEKEKIFRKELFKFLDEGSEYSLLRAKQITQLAINYSSEKKLETVLSYLISYDHLVDAFLFDFYSSYDLKKLTNSESTFQKVFKPMVESDSIETIYKADELVDHCYSYAANMLSNLDTVYFARQKRVVNTSKSDFNERKGNKLNRDKMEGQTIIARFDSLNTDGIYKWHDYIVVIGTFLYTATFDNVKRGEAILNADRRLIQYIKVNKLAKIGKEVEMGSTFLIPYIIDEKKSDFFFHPVKREYQYMVCYTRIENSYMTKGISKFLPPMQFYQELQVSR